MFTLHSGQIRTSTRGIIVMDAEWFTLHSGQIRTLMKAVAATITIIVHTPLRSDKDPGFPAS